MARQPAPTDFTVDVPSIGTHVFGRRTGRDRFKIAAEYHRLTEGLDVGEAEFGLAVEAFATIKVMLVDGPPDVMALLDLDAPAHEEQEGDAKLLRVFFALRQKELSFRPRKGEDGQAPGQGNGGEPAVLVPPQVQPGSD